MSEQPIPHQNETAEIERGGWLDVLRFVMAFLMVLHHYRMAGPLDLTVLAPVFDRGYLVTDFFLIDSGYVLGRVYGPRITSGRMGWASFFRKRLLRVVPAHLLMGLSLVGLVLIAALFGVSPRHGQWFDWSELPSQLFLVQSYGVPGGHGWNAPSWSISALLGCYLSFPLIVRPLSRLSPLAALAAGIGVFAVMDLLTTVFLGYPVYQMPLAFGFIRALPLFVFGMCLARFAQKTFIPVVVAYVMGAAAILGLIALQAFGRFSLPSLALISIMILAAGAIPVIRRSRFIEKAAVVSFSIYITNEVVRIGYFGIANVLIARFAVPTWAQWMIWGGGVAAAVGFALVFHYVADMPIQRLVQARRRRPAPKSQAESPAPAAQAA